MENTVEVKSTNNCSTESQCIIAKKVCDICTQRDCLSPIPSENSRLIDSARLCGDKQVRIDQNDSFVFEPGDLLSVPLDVTSVKLAGKFSVSECCIVSIDPLSGCCVTGQQGYWKITVRYKFTYPIKLFRGTTPVQLEEYVGSAYVPVDSILACTTWEKTVILFGGDICKCNDNCVDIAFCNSLYSPCGPYSNEKPFALVQVEACLLQLDFGTPSGTAKPINAIIGLFSIIKTYRIVNMLVETSGDCLVEENPCQEDIDDPCEFFSKLDFPFKDFDPECPLAD
ncbi:hypothetical protein RBU49_02390 [Clostridium sp. MB40-C1]|uniref:hypothetical protein n=1 Tax=Clostridium sp. MB40-C1 TaxID=3070996 RepID=UPI0027DFDF49|nr:hypothetical protein [Clostridium sp. MB40-C1]WMJ81119.1 hypothetical protein RBU49_02390 [Clostridium sp. MB40-C1]